MSRARILSILGIGLLLTSLMALAQTAPAPGTASSPAGSSNRAAVVNLREVYEHLDEKRDADRELETSRAAFSKQLESRKADIDHLSQEVAHPTLFKAGTPEFLQMQDDFLQKSLEVQGFTEFCQQKLFIQLRTRTLDIHQRMNQSIAAYAQANAITLVFVADDLPLEAARTPQELEAFPAMSKLAYFQPSYDITRAIIEKMNTEYDLTEH